MNDFFQMIKKDHVEVKGILGQLTETKETKKREELFKKLTVELVPHMKAEESAFYAPLSAKKEAHEDALEGIEEHHVSDMVYKELETMPKSQDHWGAKMSVFKELVEHHIQEEESKIFKSAEKVFEKNEFEAIMKKFEQEKQKIKKTLQ